MDGSTKKKERQSPKKPTFKSARTAAGYYNVLRSLARKGKFRVMAADVLDTSNMSRYLKRFRRYAKGSPRLWGLHNYGDVNRRRTNFTKAMLRSVAGEVWLRDRRHRQAARASAAVGPRNQGLVGSEHRRHAPTWHG